MAKSDIEATWWYLRAADQGPAWRAARGLDRMTRQPFDGIAAQQSSGMQRDCATWAPSASTVTAVSGKMMRRPQTIAALQREAMLSGNTPWECSMRMGAATAAATFLDSMVAAAVVAVWILATATAAADEHSPDRGMSSSLHPGCLALEGPYHPHHRAWLQTLRCRHE